MASEPFSGKSRKILERRSKQTVGNYFLYGGCLNWHWNPEVDFPGLAFRHHFFLEILVHFFSLLQGVSNTTQDGTAMLSDYRLPCTKTGQSCYVLFGHLAIAQ